MRPTPYTNLPKKLWGGPRRENDSSIFKSSDVNLKQTQIEILTKLSDEEIKELKQIYRGDIFQMDPRDVVYLIKKMKERKSKYGYGFGSKEEDELD